MGLKATPSFKENVVSTATALSMVLAAICIPGWMEAKPPRIVERDKPVVITAPHTRQKEALWVDEPEPHNPTPLSDELYEALTLACHTYGVPINPALGLIETESSFRTDAVSSAGCYGLCQLNPDYFPSDLTPAENINEGIHYLGDLLGRYGDTGAALTAYNAGHDTGSREYAAKVSEAAERWKEILNEI